MNNSSNQFWTGAGICKKEIHRKDSRQICFGFSWMSWMAMQLGNCLPLKSPDHLYFSVGKMKFLCQILTWPWYTCPGFPSDWYTHRCMLAHVLEVRYYWLYIKSSIQCSGAARYWRGPEEPCLVHAACWKMDGILALDLPPQE